MPDIASGRTATYGFLITSKHIIFQPGSLMETKRSQTYVDSSVQGALLRRIFVHWCSFFAVAALATISLGVLLGDPGQSFAARFGSELKSFGVIGLVMVALLPGFMLDTIRFSNRFVGPVGRLRKSLQQLKEGQSETLAFRGTDFWVEMGNEFNAISSLVKQQQDEIVQLREQLEGVSVG